MVFTDMFWSEQMLQSPHGGYEPLRITCLRTSTRIINNKCSLNLVKLQITMRFQGVLTMETVVTSLHNTVIP